MLNQPERKPDYFIQIPPDVLFKTKLSAGAKLFYGEVLFLTYTYGFCSQKNAYFAANHGVSLRTVENWIKELKALNLIKVELIRKQNKEVELRKIFSLAKIDFSKMPGLNQISVQAETSSPARITKSSQKLKKPYGANQNVFLSDNEMEELLKKHTKEQVDKAIEPKGSVAGVAYQHESIIAYAKNLQSFAEKPFTKKKEHATEMIKKVNSLIEKYGLVNNSVRNEYKEYLKTKKGDFSGGELAYSLIDDTGRVYRCVSMAAPDKPETRSHRPLMHPVTKKPCAVPQKGWRYIDKTMDDLLAKGKVEFGQDESTVPNQKYYLDENLEEAFSSMIYFGGTGSDDTVELSFDNPKPLYVMIKIVNSVCKKDSEDIILDFFSGSATTAHAVMQLNAEDGGKRNFIMVQHPEVTDEKSEAYKAGYKNICEIGKERIRRAGQQILKQVQNGKEKSHTDSSLLTQTLFSNEEEKSLDFSNPCDNIGGVAGVSPAEG